MPKNDRKPITSVIVVTKTLDAIAGSILNFFKWLELIPKDLLQSYLVSSK